MNVRLGTLDSLASGGEAVPAALVGEAPMPVAADGDAGVPLPWLAVTPDAVGSALSVSQNSVSTLSSSSPGDPAVCQVGNRCDQSAAA